MEAGGAEGRSMALIMLEEAVSIASNTNISCLYPHPFFKPHLCDCRSFAR